MKQFTYTSTDNLGVHDVAYGSDVEELSTHLHPFINKYSSFIYIIDQNLPPEILTTVKEITKVTDNLTVEIDPGQKTIAQVLKIWDSMVKSVPSAAIVIGGGTVGDISGLACGAYQRGIPRLYFPTTVLSMVDASIGGKSGIDYGNIKNSIGLMHYPESVVNYVGFTDSLLNDEYYAGFAEVIKAAVIYDKTFFDELEGLQLEHRLSHELLIDILYKASIIKASICEQVGDKKIQLLYGHAIGHAYEKLLSGHTRHGDCVAIGMNFEGALAVNTGIWNEEQWRRQANLITKFHLPLTPPQEVSIEDLIAKMGKYKKLVNDDCLSFALPEKIGSIANKEADARTPFNKIALPELLMKAEEKCKTLAI
jgi:3-dehydroquinate synthetase